MRFCLSLTAHYSILHLTGSASFTDDPFNKCFSKSFFGLKMWSFWMHLCLERRTENLGKVSCFSVWHKLAALCCALTSSLSCQFDSETQAYDYMWKNKGSGRRFKWIVVYSPKKKKKKWRDGAKSVHACVEECWWEQQKGLDGTCGSGLTVSSLTESGSRREEAKAEPFFFVRNVFFFYQQ